jgi:hypothetical protein
MDTVISKNHLHSISHISGQLNSLSNLFKISNSLQIFNFASEIRFVNQIKNTVLKLKEEEHDKFGTKFDPNSIDERVRDFFFDSKTKKMYVTLLCGQIFIFNKKSKEVEEEQKDEFKFMINKKVTLKQKILKMKKIDGFRKELVIDSNESERFEDQLEAMTTTTTGSRSITLSSRRSSSLMRTSHYGNQIRHSNIRSKSLKK